MAPYAVITRHFRKIRSGQGLPDKLVVKGLRLSRQDPLVPAVESTVRPKHTKVPLSAPLRHPAPAIGASQELDAAMGQAWRVLAVRATKPDFVALLRKAFGGEQASSAGWSKRASELQRLLTGSNGLPGLRFELADNNTMKGLLGAFAGQHPSGQPTILINADWFATASEQQRLKLLLQEIGHSIDLRLNGASGDSRGDEGALFANLVTASNLKAIDPIAFNYNDHFTINLSGQSIDVEASAGIVNPGFEAATALQGWTAIGTAGVASAAISGWPAEGNYYAYVTSENSAASVSSIESNLGLPQGKLNLVFNNPDSQGGVTGGSIIYQTVSISAGSTISFDWSFATSKYKPYNDAAFFSVSKIDAAGYATSSEIFKLSDVVTLDKTSTNQYVITPKSTFNYGFGETGTFRLGFGAINEGDIQIASTLYLDNLNYLTSAPLAVNLPPKKTSQTASFTKASSGSTSIPVSALLQGFTDPDGNALQVTGFSVSPGSFGAVYGAGGSGQVTSYTVNAPTNYTGNISINYNVSDGHGGVLAASNVITTLANVAPVATASDPSASLIEAGGAGNAIVGLDSASITITKFDSDGTANFDTAYLTTTAGWSTSDSGLTYTKAGTYGTATFTLSSGVVSYSLNNAATATQALTANQSVTDSFGNIQVTDGTATALSTALVFSISGSNDTPTVSASSPTATLVEAGGASNGTAGVATASITLSKGDVDGSSSPAPVIDLGGLGKLIAPVQVEGKTYYHWDRNNDGTINGDSYNRNGGTFQLSEIYNIFNQDINGAIGSATNETYRYATINGVELALPTLGTSPVYRLMDGTAISDPSTTNTIYDDLSAVWDSYNGSLVGSYVGQGLNGANRGTGNVTSGAPLTWVNDTYVSATPWPSSSDYASLRLYDGLVLSHDNWAMNVALEVLSSTFYDTAYLTSQGWTSIGNSDYTKSGIYGNATLSLNSDVVTYSLNNVAAATQGLAAGQSATDSFGSLQVSDGSATTLSAPISFAITGSNDAPSINAKREVQQTLNLALTTSNHTYSFGSPEKGSGEYGVTAQAPAGGFANAAAMASAFQAHPNYGALPYTIGLNPDASQLVLTFKTDGNFGQRWFERWGDGSIGMTTLQDGQSTSAILMETNAALAASGSVGVSDGDLSGSVTASVLNLNTSGQTNGLASELVSQAVQLDGNGDFVEVPDNATLDLNSPFTLEAWINPSGTGSGAGTGGIILNKEDSYEIARFGDGSIQFAFMPPSGSGWTWINTGLHAPLNAWSHVALTHSGSSVTVYLNGGTAEGGSQATVATVANGNPPSTLAASDKALRIGGRESRFQDFQGQIADVRLWNVARSAETIASGRFSALDPSSIGLVANYRFDGSGSTVPNAATGPSAAPVGTLQGEASRTAAQAITDGNGLTNSQLLSMLTLTPTPVLSSGQTSGTLNWAFNSGSEAFNNLRPGEQLNLNYTVRVTDNAGASADQPITVTISGSNDVPVISSNTVAHLGTVIEAGDNDDGSVFAGTGSISQTLNATDADANTTLTWSITGSPSTTYGGFAIDAATGRWTYTLDNSLTATQGLAEGQTVTQSYTARVTDDLGASTNQSVTITILGSNDRPTVSASSPTATLVEAGGASNGTAGVASASITLSKADVDGTANFDTAYLTTTSNGWSTSDSGLTYTKAGTYGSATFTLSSGVVSYSLNNSATATQSLTANQSVTDSFGNIQVTDGTATALSSALVFSITGSNDTPTVSASSPTATLVEAGGASNGTAGVASASITASGALWASGVYDPDQPTVSADNPVVLSSVGSSAYSGSHTDGSPGNVYIQETPSGQTGTVTQWKFYKPHSTEGLWVTPVIYEKTIDNTFIVRGVGRSRSASGPAGVYTFDFEVVEGSAVFANTHYTYGHIDNNLNNSAGSIGTASTGSISERGTGTGTWGFINTQNPITTVGASQSITYHKQRHYSSELILSSGGSGVPLGGEGDAMALQVASADVRTHTGSYGALTVNADGSYSYVVNNSNAVVNALREDQSLDDLFSLSLLDTTSGLTTSRDLRIRIDGTDDRPLTTGSIVDTSVDEAGLSGGTNSAQPLDSAFAYLMDPEGDAFTPTVTAARTADGSFAPVPLSSASSTGLVLVGNYGNLSIGADGSYTYTLNNSNPAVNALREDQSLDDSFVLALTTTQGAHKDVIEQPLVIRIDGSNDAPISGGVISAGPAIEAGVVNGGNTTLAGADISGETASLFAKLSDPEGDSFTVTGGRHSSQSIASAPIAMANGLKVELYEGINFNTLRNTRTEASINFYDAYDTSYGGNGDTFSIRATGQIQAYQTGTNTFKVGSDDGVRVWINNALVVDSWRDRGIAFDSFSFVGTQGSWYDIKIEYYESIGGAALILRNNDNTLVTALRSVQNNAIAGTYGNLTLDPSGSYLYSLNQTANNVQSLQAGDNLSETFFVTVSDGQGGSVEQQLNISISGSNDQPQITTAIADPTFTEFTSASSQTLIASGTLAFNDVDAADSANAAVILKNPANWNGGTLNASLKAALEAGFTLTTATSGLTSPGSVGWAYNASNLNLDFLAQGQSITLTYTVNITDPRGGIGSDDVTITIYGSNDGPVVTNGPTELLGAVTEAGHLPNGTVVVGTPSVSGTLSASDLDSGATRTWSIAGSPSTTYGNLAINASTGVWTYTLENNATATQALAEGQSVTQSYIARVTDNNGATADQTVTITINGTNDKPDIVDPNRSSTATFSSSSEGWSNGKLMTSSQWGSLLGPYGVAESSSKVFSGTSPIQAISFDWFRLDSWDGEQFKIKANGVDIYSGSFHFGTIPTANSSGTSGGFSWTLAPKEYGNYANAGWQDQRFVFTLTPPANTTNLTLHLSSTLDQASYDEAWGIDNVTITRLSTAVFEGSVLEAGAVDAGTASVSGTLTASDLDTGASLSWSLVGTPSTTYGSIAIDASTGVWTYTLKNDATATQALAEGQSVTQSYIARVTDEFGTYAEQTVTVTINGSNDQPTVSANTPGVPLGGTDPLPIDALLRVSDPDNTQLASALVRIEDPRTGDRLLWNVDLAQAKGLELTYSTTTAELSISGVALVEDYQAVLRTVAYAVDWGQTSAPAAGSSRSIAIQVVDANYGTRGQASSDLYRTTIQLAQIATSPAPATAQEDNGSVTTTGPLAQLPALHLFNPATSTLSLTGQLALSDSDFGQQLFSPVVREWSPSAGVANGGERAGANLGALTITADGNWIYMLDNTHPFIQALRAGEQRLESFLVQSLDGTARQRIDITIEGCDDHLVQYASQVLRMSSEGKDPDSDVYKRWFASQALGAPNTDFGDIDTAWSPRRRNSEISNGDAFDEYIELGFSRSVRATGARIHETAGLGFVREVWGSYLDDQGVRKYTATPLWVGTDNAAINEAAPGVLELSFAGNTQLIDGLLILVDIDHTDFWEQIDAVELIGIATPESYVPRAPTIDDVAEDNRVNLAEKTAGVMLSGNYDHHTSTHVDVRWGGKTFAAQLNAEQGLWWYTVSAENVPSDLQSSTIEVQSFDRSDARSGDRFASKSVSATVVIDTVAPGRPTLAVVAVDDAINQYEKYATGVTLSGTAEPLSTIEIAWDYKQPRKVQVDANGAWSLDFSAAQIPYDEVNSHILVTAIDAAGNRSLAFDRPVVIDTDAPLKATINPLHWSDSVNAAQKAAGVPVTGSAEIGASVDVSWVQADGSRITRSTTADRAGVIGIAGASTTVTLRFGSTLLGTATSGANGEFLYLFKEADLTLFRQNAADSTLVLTAGWTENGVAVQTSRLQLATGLWQTIFNSSDVPADGNATRLEAVATDAQGNVSRVKTDAVLVDTQAPAAPVIDDWDQNLNAEELADTLLIKGTAELGASLVLRLMGESTTARASTGRWTAQFTPAQLERIRAAFDLAGGMATLTAQAFDSLGNPSALFSQVITVDAALPTVPTFKRASGSFLTAVDRRDGFTLEGTAEPLTTVELTWGTLRRSVIAAADGAWSVRFAPAEIPADTASSLLLAQSVDAVGNRSEIAELALVIDTVAPSLQLLSVGGADSVLSASGGDQLITGLAEPLRPLSLWLSGGGRLQPVLLVEAIADRQGVFTLTLTTTQLAAVGDGIGHKLEVRQTDAAGNSAVSAPFSFALDTEAPTINLTSIGGEDGVISSAAGDSLIRGTAEPGQPVTVRASRSDGASRQLGVVTPDAQGAFSLSLTAATLAALGQGSGFTLSLSQSDAAGNSTSSNRSFAIDTIAPAAPVIQAAGGLDTTLSTAAGDNTITGLGEAGATVSLWLTDSTGALTNLGTTVSTSAGQFSVGLTAAQLSALPQGGGLILEARITDTAGNTGLSKPFSVSVDTIAPAQPTLTDIGGADRTLTTAAGDAQIQGKASPYSTVELEADVDGVRLALGSTTSTGKGLFSKALTLESLASLGQGVRRFWAVVRDAAGNVARSTALDATVDTVAEQVPYNLSLGGSDAVVSTVSGDQMIRGQAVPGRPVTLSAIVPARGASSSFTLELGTVNPDATGAFTALLSSRHLQDLGQGSGIQLVASQADAVGNLGRSAPLLFEIDTVAPATPKITAVGGADSVITNKITNVLGTAPAGSAVSLWGSNDGSTYSQLTTVTATVDGRFTHALTVAQLAAFQQGSGRLLKASVSDAAGNIATSFPFTFSLETLAPVAPSITSINGEVSGAIRFDVVAKAAGGLKLSGQAPGAAVVELNIEGFTDKPQALPNSDGNWTLLISQDKFPQSKTLTTRSLELTALNRHGDRSAPTKASLRIDTAAPTILNVIQQGDRIRIILDELVQLSSALTTQQFSVRAGISTVAVKAISSLVNGEGNTELVLQLARPLTTNSVVKLNYSGSEITDSLGNPLANFSNRVVSHVLSGSSIGTAGVTPAYNYATFELSGAAHADISANQYDNVLIGNSGDNLLKGGLGADVITGGLGRDTFVYANLRDSVLIDPVTNQWAVDRITDLKIGTDIIDAPNPVPADGLKRVSSASVALERNKLSELLPASLLPANGGAVLSLGSDPASTRTFLVLNDGIAGYNAYFDSLIEITGYTGVLNDLRVI